MPDNSDYFDFEEDAHDFDEDDFEARVWNLLVLINPGDEVVTSGTFRLRNGAAISVQNNVQPSNNPAPKPEDN